MKNLSKNWLTEDLIDFEYKKYLLLAYLQEVKGNFDSVRLYPYLSDLIFHYQNLLSIKENKHLMYENFPKSLSKADFEKLTFQYKKIIADDDLMKQIEDIILFALPQLKKALDDGKTIYQYVEENIEISPVGLTSLYAQEGYLFIKENNQPETKVYEYQISIFENANEKYRAIHTNFLEVFYKSVNTTFENLKIEIVRKYNKLPNPATYLIFSKSHFPFDETLLPIAKRLLVKYIAESD